MSMDIDPMGSDTKEPGEYCRRAFAESEGSMADTAEAGTDFFASIAARIEAGTYDNVVLTGEGSSYTAELMCESVVRRAVPIPFDLVLATEFPHWRHLVSDRTLVLVLSRTGERKFILDAVDELKAQEARVVALVGNPDARLNDRADEVFLTREGPEPGFLKSKSTFSGVAAVLSFAAACTARGGDHDWIRSEHVQRLASCVGDGFKLMNQADLSRVAPADRVEHWALGGAGHMYATAVDGALKLHEITTVAATPYHLTSLYHGPLGQLSNRWGAIVMATDTTRTWADLLAQEIANVGADPVVYLGAGGLEPPTDDVVGFPVPNLPGRADSMSAELADALSPATFLPALYTLTLELALARGLDPDSPPNMEYMLKLILPEGQVEPDLLPSGANQRQRAH